MTTTVEPGGDLRRPAASTPPVRLTGRAGLLRAPWVAPTVAAAVSALTFLVVHPAVGDLWAAQARQFAAGHGVGLTYWFAWYGGGTAPGSYSVLTPVMSAVIGAPLLGALATVAITPLAARLAAGTPHPVAATWLTTFTCGISLWSGRVPFAVGTAAAVATLLAVRHRQRAASCVGAVATALCSPVAGALLGLGLVGALVVRGPHRRVAASTVAAAAATLVTIAVVFGSPGPEGFPIHQAVVAELALALFLVARPSRAVRDVVIATALVCPVLVAVPNGMGSNVERLVWLCLPPAVVATARARPPLVLAGCVTALTAGAVGTITDLVVGHAPMSAAAYYAPLVRELDRLPDLSSYRVEYVPDGTHTAAYVLLDHAMLARGYETQADNAFNAEVDGGTLDPATFRAWLDDNAVGYVVIDAETLHQTSEYTLVAHRRPAFLSPVWQDARWRLYRVTGATPIVRPPARVIAVDQSSLQVDVPRAGAVAVRVRFSGLLTVDSPAGVGPAVLRSTGDGWTTLTAAAPGRYVLHGR